MLLYTLVELSASFIESLLVISTITRISGKKHTNPQHILLILAATCVMTTIVTFMNMWESFSYLTIVIAATYSICITKLTIERSSFAPHRILHAYFIFSTYPRLCSWL